MKGKHDAEPRPTQPLYRSAFTQKYFFLTCLLEHVVEYSVSPPEYSLAAFFSRKLTPLQDQKI